MKEKYETLNNDKFAYLGESITNLKKSSRMMNTSSIFVGFTLGLDAMDEVISKIDFLANINIGVLSVEACAVITTVYLNKLLSKSLDDRKSELHSLVYNKRTEIENNIKEKLKNIKRVTTLTYLSAVLETFASYLKFDDSCNTNFGIDTLYFILGNALATYFAFKSGDLLYNEENKRKEEFVRIRK